MKPTEAAMRRKRQGLLRRLGRLAGLLHGSYVERFSVCARKGCLCHHGKRHGPRSYLVVYRRKRQRQLYVRQAERSAVRRGLRQHEQAQAIIAQLTDVNLQLLRLGHLAPQAAALRRRGGHHG